MTDQAPRRVRELPPDAPSAPAIPVAAPPPPPSVGPEPTPEHLAELKRMAGQQDRPARRPFGRQEYRLANFPFTPGFVPRWFNDTPGRIARALGAGYRHVLDPDGIKYTLTVGRAEGGGGQLAYWMEIPKEFYDEDFAAKQANLDVIDTTIRRGRHKADEGDKRYGEVSQRITGGRPPRSF